VKATAMEVNWVEEGEQRHRHLLPKHSSETISNPYSEITDQRNRRLLHFEIRRLR